MIAYQIILKTIKKHWKWFLTIPAVIYILLRLFRSENQTINEVKTELDKLRERSKTDKTQLPTYTASQYKGFANVLFAAMDGSGTDEAVIKDVFSKMKKRRDVLELIAAYGTRQLSGLILKDGDKGTLNYHLAFEGVRDIANQGLSVHNVYYTF